jgi:hypothetical protein
MDRKRFIGHIKDFASKMAKEGKYFNRLGISYSLEGVDEAGYYILASADWLDEIDYSKGCGIATDCLIDELHEKLNGEAWKSLMGVKLIDEDFNIYCESSDLFVEEKDLKEPV